MTYPITSGMSQMYVHDSSSSPIHGRNPGPMAYVGIYGLFHGYAHTGVKSSIVLTVDNGEEVGDKS